MKDPAFLFYPNDYLGGTMGMTFEEKGAYMELLMLQFNRGHMTTHMIGQTVGQLWVNLKDKFIMDKDGLFYNVRLEQEQNKRKAFTDSRRNNINGENQYTKKEGHMNGRMTSHMEDVNRNTNEVLVFDKNMMCFENFRIKYPGRKNGFETEYKNFLKKSKPQDVELLLPALEDEIEYRQISQSMGAFIPDWKNLQTWINKKCWLQVLPEIKTERNGTIKKPTSRNIDIDGIVNAVYEAHGM